MHPNKCIRQGMDGEEVTMDPVVVFISKTTGQTQRRRVQVGGVDDTREVHGKQGAEDQRHHTVETSQSGWAEVWKQSCGIVLDGENWCEVLHGRLIVTRDETMKQDINDGQSSCIILCEKQFNVHCTLFLNSDNSIT